MAAIELPALGDGTVSLRELAERDVEDYVAASS